MDLAVQSLNFNQLRLFLAVAEHGGMTRAAEAVFVSQPAVSASVAELERQLGVPLLEHVGRRVVLTDAGRTLADYAQRIFTLAGEARRAMDETRGLEWGSIVVGASTTIGIYLLPAVMGVFHARYPAITLSLLVENTDLVLERLHEGALDLALVEGPVVGDAFVVTPYQEDVLVLVTAPTHPLALRGNASREDLAAAPFLMREAGSGTREIVEAALRAHGVIPAVAMELGHTEAIKQGVAVGLGISILSALTVRQEIVDGLLTVVPMDGLTVRRTLWRVQRREARLSNAARAFLPLLTDSPPEGELTPIA